MFVGREKETAQIKEFLRKCSGSVMIYGKRKVGKTTLLNHALRNEKNVAYYECMKDSLKANIEGLTDVLVRERILPAKIDFPSFQELFRYLNSLEGSYNIVIDEYPYLKVINKPETVDSVFQSVIDNNLKNVRLFISGSHIGMMKDLLAEKNALYGRFTLNIRLDELDYTDAARFYPGLDEYDKIGFYSVFGGSPFVNEFIDSEKNLRENIISTVLNSSSSVYNYADNLLLSDLSNSSGAERIFAAIANGRKKYGEIEKHLRIEKNGLLSKQLIPLINMEIITKSFPINRPDDKKKVFYEINDNLLRFYYAYVYRNKSILQRIGAEAFYEEYIEQSLITFISHRFEKICRDYFSLLVKNGKMKGIRDIGTFYYDDSVTKKNGEFDIVLERKDRFDFYEAKYYKTPLSHSEMRAEEKQIRDIHGLNPGYIGFISTAGFEAEPKDYICVTADKLYSLTSPF
ncbi:MAG: AAA family ATPase [Clostridia bacterium]|nr:AAA family ATPase [Clostridia bacterium]